MEGVTVLPNSREIIHPHNEISVPLRIENHVPLSLVKQVFPAVEIKTWTVKVVLIIYTDATEGELNNGGYIPRREAWRYITTALYRP